jgi:nucleoside-diphosphate-sugar epimerase
MKVLILGVNGFIGNSLVKTIMERTDWEVYGMDLSCSKLDHSFDNPRFHFVEGDISINREWVEYNVKKCDVVLPLVAIATPMTYVKSPLRVFELDFEENLRVIRQCVRYEKRIVFPSTSEVYGMCADPEFDEDTSDLVLGPIHKQRWIYSCAKQLLDRVIWAYGESAGLRFTLFRPFNWIGPKLDDIYAAKIGSSRVVTQIIIDLVRGQPIKLVDGGSQKRCFTYIDDGIDCVMKIIEDKDNVCNGQIFNVGNPNNECSIRELAHKLVELSKRHPACKRLADSVKVIEVTADNYYGKGYQDISSRKPSIRKAQTLLNWAPRVSLNEALKATFDFFVEESIANGLL